MTTQTTPEQKLHAICYSDGGCKNNHVGWGFHGYVYKDTDPKKGSGNPIYKPSVVGYVPKASKEKEVSVLKYFDGYGSHKEPGTNNVAEMLAAYNALSKFSDYTQDNYAVKSITVKTDSEYVRKGITEYSKHWIKNNWIRSDGTPVPNKELWKTLLEKVDTIKLNNIDVNVIWVEGHQKDVTNGSPDKLGNDIADKLATIARIGSETGHHVTSIKTSPSEAYWKLENNTNPLFFNKRLYFNTLRHSQHSGVYYLGDHSKEDDHLGKKFGDGAYSVVILKEEEPVLEMVRKHQTSMTGDMDAIIMVRLDQLFSPSVYKDIEEHGHVSLVRKDQNSLDLYTLDKQPLTKEMKPPRLAMRAIDCLSTLRAILDNYINKSDTNLCETDVTATFYEDQVKTTKKEVITQKVLKSNFVVGFGSLEVSVDFKSGRDNNRIVQSPVNLTLGIDIASRNSLKKLEALDVKVVVVTWREVLDVYRYATVILSKDGTCISAGMYSNTIFRSL